MPKPSLLFQQEELVVTKKTSVFEKSKPTASATAAAAAVPATTQAASTVAASTTAQGQEVDVKKLTVIFHNIQGMYSKHFSPNSTMAPYKELLL